MSNLYLQHLYESIIDKNAPFANSLRVISGYGSPQFVETVITQFAHLYIELYIGMTHQGISCQDHENYQSLMKESDRLKVFYQVSNPPNHIKLIEFNGNRDIQAYAGSANFTNNGFFLQQELMFKINESFNSLNDLFEKQKDISLLCTDLTINDYINFYQDKNIFIEDNIDSNGYFKEHKKEYRQSNSTEIGKKWRELRKGIDLDFYRQFHIELLSTIPEAWENSTINAWTIQNEPVLQQTPRLMFDTVFPTNQEFTIHTDDGMLVIGELTGSFNKFLNFKNIDLYEYICKRIGLKEKRPIHYSDLYKYGRSSFSFERLNMNQYLMMFTSEKGIFQ